MVFKSTVEASGGIGVVIDVERYSDLESLLRVTTFVVKFMNNLKKSMKKTEGVYGGLVVEELVFAEKLWAKHKQSIIGNGKL